MNILREIDWVPTIKRATALGILTFTASTFVGLGVNQILQIAGGTILTGGVWAWTRLDKENTESILLRVLENCGLYIKAGDRKIFPKIVQNHKSGNMQKMLIKNPPGICLSDWLKLQEEISSALRADVEMWQGDDYLHLLVMSGGLKKAVKYAD